MIINPDPFDRAAVLAALRAKLAEIQRRQRCAADPRALWGYVCDVQDAIWSLEAEMGIVMQPMGARNA